jgi:hypothetical protein
MQATEQQHITQHSSLGCVAYRSVRQCWRPRWPHPRTPSCPNNLRKLANLQTLETHRTTSVLIPEQIRDFWRGLATLWPWGQRSRAWWTTTVGRDGMKTMQTLAKVSRTRIPCPSTTHAANCRRATHILSRRIRYKFDGIVKGLGG